MTITPLDANGYVTMSNGVLSVTVNTRTSHVSLVVYTYNNNGTPRTAQTLQSSTQYYWGGFIASATVGSQFGNLPFAYTLAIDPATNNGEHADIKLVSTEQGLGGFEVHFTL